MKDKLKIGILSFPTACNHGAYLQVYALRGYLLEQNYNVKVINYRNKKHFLNEMRSMFVKKNVQLILFNLIRYLGFRRAQKRFDMVGMSFSHQDIGSDSYDVIIVGGDIVWDFGSSFIGHDPIYYGHNLKSKKVIAYAASAGNSKVGDCPNYVKSGIKNFSGIGVRDSESYKIANVIDTKANKSIVLDTTLIYDFPLTSNINHSKKYILIYAFTVTEDDRFELISFAAANDLDILSITFNNSHSWATKNFSTIDPLDFVELVRNAAYVFTSTFHGLLFSIKYRKQVALRNNPTIASKCSWLIENLSLDSVVISKESSVSKIFNNDRLFPESFNDHFDSLVLQSTVFLNSNIEV